MKVRLYFTSDNHRHLNNYRKKLNGSYLRSFGQMWSSSLLMADVSSGDDSQHMAMWWWPIYPMINQDRKSATGNNVPHLSKRTAWPRNDHLGIATKSQLCFAKHKSRLIDWIWDFLQTLRHFLLCSKTSYEPWNATRFLWDPCFLFRLVR